MRELLAYRPMLMLVINYLSVFTVAKVNEVTEDEPF